MRHWFFPLPIRSVIGIIVVVEQPLRELVEVVVALAAFEQVAEDHRVGERTGELDAGAAQREHVVLDVLADLLDRGIGQDRAAGPASVARSARARAARPARAPAGNRPLPAFQQNDSPTSSARRGSIAVVSVSTQNRGWARSSARNAGEPLRRIDGVVLGLPGLLGGGRRRLSSLPSSSRNRWKPHSVHRAFRAATSGGWVLSASQSSASGRSSRRATSCRRAAGPSPCSRRACCFLGPLTRLGVREQVVERAEFLEERAGEARADAGHARDVVDGVAGQRQEVDDLVGADAPILSGARRRPSPCSCGGCRSGLVADQLAGVLVGGDDEDVEPALLAAAGQGRDHVVGLHPGLHEDRHAKALEDPANHRESGGPGRRASPCGFALYSA